MLGLRRSPGVGNGSPLQYPCLENPMDRGGWWATVHGVTKSQTRLSDWTEPTPISLPGESHGQSCLEGYSPQGHKELDTTEGTEHAHTHPHTQVALTRLLFTALFSRKWALLPVSVRTHADAPGTPAPPSQDTSSLLTFLGSSRNLLQSHTTP